MDGSSFVKAPKILARRIIRYSPYSLDKWRSDNSITDVSKAIEKHKVNFLGFVNFFVES